MAWKAKSAVVISFVCLLYAPPPPPSPHSPLPFFLLPSSPALSFPLAVIPDQINELVQARVSVDRLVKFLQLPEMTPVLPEADAAPGSIDVKNASFTWDVEEQESEEGGGGKDKEGSGKKKEGAKASGAMNGVAAAGTSETTPLLVTVQGEEGGRRRRRGRLQAQLQRAAAGQRVALLAAPPLTSPSWMSLWRFPPGSWSLWWERCVAAKREAQSALSGNAISVSFPSSACVAPAVLPAVWWAGGQRQVLPALCSAGGDPLCLRLSARHGDHRVHCAGGPHLVGWR